MPSRECRVRLFCEDIAHERWLRALIERLAGEEDRTVQISVGNARGGHGRVLTELSLQQRVLEARGEIPDVLVIGIDANCKGWSQARKEVLGAVNTESFPAIVTAIPDPHIERWFMADPRALKAVADAHLEVTRRKCERHLYKKALIDALRAAGHPVTLGGAEFAEEVVQELDLYQAGKSEPSLKHTLDELRAALRRPG